MPHTMGSTILNMGLIFPSLSGVIMVKFFATLKMQMNR